LIATDALGRERMNSRTTAEEHTGGCWCCGRPTPQGRLLTLGARPEAAVCLDCAAHLHRRAREAECGSALTRLPAAAAGQVRDAVMAARLHRLPALGPALRWINRRSRF
jgi:hypothetical protein